MLGVTLRLAFGSGFVYLFTFCLILNKLINFFVLLASGTSLRYCSYRCTDCHAVWESPHSAECCRQRSWYKVIYESIFDSAKLLFPNLKSKTLLESLHLLELEKSVPVPGVHTTLLPVGPCEHGVVSQLSMSRPDIMFLHEQCRNTLLQVSLIAATAKFDLSKPSVIVVFIVFEFLAFILIETYSCSLVLCSNFSTFSSATRWMCNFLQTSWIDTREVSGLSRPVCTWSLSRGSKRRKIFYCEPLCNRFFYFSILFNLTVLFLRVFSM